MNYILKTTSIFLLSLFAFTSLNAQSDALAKANKYYELGDYQQAIVSYKTALGQNPNETSIYGNLANAYRFTNDLNSAADMYNKAVRVSNPNPEHFFQYGLVLRMLGQYDNAKAFFIEYSKVNAAKGQAFVKSTDFAIARKDDASVYTIRKETVNSSADDYAPAIYKGNVIFASARTDKKNEMNDNAAGWKKGTMNQLLMARPNADGQIGNPVVLKKSFKSKTNEAPISFTNDGKTVAFTNKNNFINGVRQVPEAGAKMRIYLADVASDDEWKNEKAFAYNQPEKYNTGYPCLTPDGTALYFASDMSGGFGGMDIYVSYKVDGVWSVLQNLGSKVNTPGDEIAPFIDGASLYFSSNYLPGFGGMDIFRAEQTDGAWSRVLHLGTGINSAADDYGLVFDKARGNGYFTSNREGNADVYSLTMPSSERIEIVVLSDNGQPVPFASIDFSSCGQGSMAADANGRFKFIAKEGLDCNVVVSQNGYGSKTVRIASSDKNLRLLEVRLPRNANVAGRYVGTVIDAVSSKFIPTVKVKVKNMANGESTETYTDNSGLYSLDLAPGNLYVLNYSKAGYTLTSRNVNTGNGADKTILGTQKIEIATSGTPPVTVLDDYTFVDSEDSKGPDAGAATTDLSYLPNIAYDVQFGVFSNPNKDELRKLKALGFVYSAARSGSLRAYKVGAYKTRSEAQATRQKLVDRGYTGAFITTLTNKKHMQRVLVKNDNSGTPIAVDPPKKPNTSGMKPPGKPGGNLPTPTTSQLTYKVQLGAYRNPKSFDKSTVAGLGELSYITISNGLTLILLGEHASYKDAKLTEQKVKARGQGAMVVAVKDGRRVPLGSN